MNPTFQTRHRTTLWLLVALGATVVLLALPFLLETAFTIAGSLLRPGVFPG
ncbi:MAG: hypothetical protein ACREIA_13315 [Opitutaceae bacterium]